MEERNDGAWPWVRVSYSKLTPKQWMELFVEYESGSKPVNDICRDAPCEGGVSRTRFYQLYARYKRWVDKGEARPTLRFGGK